MNKMKNLQGIKLKNSIKKNIYEALENSKEPEVTIKFKFLIQDDPNFKETEKIWSFTELNYKGISFIDVKRETAIAIITNNFHYDYFCLIDKDVKKTRPEIHGYGEFWGTETWTFTYMRFKE